jgi:glycosyltransferase involved in cell wall biosynthesis
MIYLDVTAAARSPITCGIPRTIRRLYTALQALQPVTPLTWSPRYRSYCRLGDSERRFLEKPFARHGRAMSDPSAVGRQWHQIIARRFSQRRSVVSLDELCQPTQMLFMTDVCEGQRAAWLEHAADRGQLQMVALFHDAIPHLRPDLTPQFRRQDFDSYLRNLARFHLVITISHESREALLAAWQTLSYQPVPVVIEPWPAEFGPRGTADLSRFEQRRVLYVSTLDPRKNHLVLFEACAQLWREGHRFELDLIGRRLSERRASAPILSALKRLQRGGYPVRWHRQVSDEALVEAYRDCSFTVYPSLMEGFGLPIHESLWFGRPCVCGTNGALGEVAAGGGCLPCDQTRPDSLATAVRQLLTDRALYTQLAEEAERRPFRSWLQYAEALQQHCFP